MEPIHPATEPAEPNPATDETVPTSRPTASTSKAAMATSNSERAPTTTKPTTEPTNQPPHTTTATPNNDQTSATTQPTPSAAPTDQRPGFAEPAAAAATERPKPDRLSARLRRRRDGRMIAGVCTGLGSAWGIDPVLARLLFAAIGVIFFPLGPLAYVVFWMLMPEED